jgi:hypothetical protein
MTAATATSHGRAVSDSEPIRAISRAMVSQASRHGVAGAHPRRRSRRRW